MKTRLIPGILLLAVVALCVAGTKISQLRRTTTLNSNDLFMVVRTTDGRKTNFNIEARNVAVGLGPWITNTGTGGGGSGDVSTAQLNAASNAAIATARADLKSYATNLGTLPGVFTNIVYINATGATTVANGTILTNALNSTLQNVRFVVGPGIYWNPTNTMPSAAFAADNRIIEFQPGATWIIGVNGGLEDAFMFDDQAGKRTNVHVVGRGNFYQTNNGTAEIAYIENGSKITWEYNEAVNTGSGGVLSWAGGVSNNITVYSHGKSVTGYDLFYGGATAGTRFNGFLEEAETQGDALEVSTDSPQWGLIRLHIRKLTSLTNGQPSVAIISGRVTLQVDEWDVIRPGTISSSSSTTNGLVIGGNWRWPSYTTNAVVQDTDLNGYTPLWIKDATITYPAPLDCFVLSNAPNTETILENVKLVLGTGGTNLVRAKSASRLNIRGGLTSNRILPFSSGITLAGTNIMPGAVFEGLVRNKSGMVNSNGATFWGDVTVREGFVDALEFYSDTTFVTNALFIPTGSGYRAIGEGSLAYDLNFYASGRGAVFMRDATDDVALLGVLASDTPANGQVPKYNSASGTITWENDTGGGSVGAGSVEANANQFNTNTMFNIKSGALLTNLQARGLTPLGLTASRATFIDASGNLTNVNSGSPSTEYVKADGTTGTPSGSGSLITNGNQFGASVTLTIANGALLTNVNARGVTIPILTASRAVTINASGNLTNSTGVTDTELEFLDGVTSAIQTQLGGKQNGQTNGNQFGASTTITIANGALLTNISSRGVTIPIITADRAVGVNASGNLTNSPNVTLAELEFLDGVTSGIQAQLAAKQNGSFILTNFIAMGITNIASANGNIVITTNSGVLTLTGSSGGSGGTNFPPVINQLGSTNLSVTAGVRQAVTITTNASFAFNLAGTPLNGSTFLLGISNFSASAIYMTTFVANAASSAFYPGNASNVTVFAVPPTSIRWLEFLSETNFNLGTARWNIIRDQGKEMELTAGYGVEFGTNSAGTYITNGIVATLRNLVGTVGNNVTNGNANQFTISTGTINIEPAAIVTNLLNHALTANITGLGGANTNFTLLATNLETTLNGFTNVSIRAVMSYVDGVSLYWTCLITNGSGSDRTIEFSAVTNRYRFAGTYGTNAPTTLTNGTQLLLSGRSLGTNTLIGYTYFPWP